MDPIPMILHCPWCGHLHVDKPEPESGWTNPPHRSHLCHDCGFVWRPCDLPTVGVEAIETTGQPGAGLKKIWLLGVPRDNIRMMQFINELRREEGDFVGLPHDAADFGVPNNLVECSGDWTEYAMRSFTGDTLLKALEAAVQARRKKENEK